MNDRKVLNEEIGRDENFEERTGRRNEMKVISKSPTFRKLGNYVQS